MAGELNVKVDTNKYAARISMLDGYVTQLSNLMDGYNNLMNRVGDFMGSDDNVEKARTAASIGVKRCQKGIEATKANIDTIQKILDATTNVGKNIETILDAAINVASAGLFD